MNTENLGKTQCVVNSHIKRRNKELKRNPTTRLPNIRSGQNNMLVSISDSSSSSNQQTSSYEGSTININTQQKSAIRLKNSKTIKDDGGGTGSRIQNSLIEVNVEPSNGAPIQDSVTLNRTELTCDQRFREIQQLNIKMEQQAINDFENVLRNNFECQESIEIEHGQKQFEEEYRPYLEASSDANCIPIFDTKQDLMKARTIDKKLKDQFIHNLQKQNKIDNYQVSISPILTKLMQQDKQMIHYKDILHPRTSAQIASCLESETDEEKSISLSNDEKEEDLDHLILSVQVEHYSFNEAEQFMIVKTIEEMNDNLDNFNVIQTLRIFKERIDPKKKNKNLIFLNARDDSVNISGQSLIKEKITQFLKNKSAINNGDPNPVEKKRIPRYEQIEQIIVSDSGPMKKHLEKLKMGKFQQTTSILFYGNYIFYFQKDYKFGKADYTLQQLDLQKIGTDGFKQEIKGIFSKNNQLMSRIQIYWAQESESKGKQLIFSDQELQDLEIAKTDFLSDQFIQIIDQDNIEQILIYSLKSSNQCLSQGIQMPKTKYQTLHFNEFFVKRECENSKSQLKDVLNFDAEGQGKYGTQNDNKTCHFLCFYNSSYMSLKLLNDGNLSNQCQKTLIYPYVKSGANIKVATKTNPQQFKEQFRKGFIEKNLRNTNEEIPDTFFGHLLNAQIRCLQNINVLKFRANQRKQKLSYFDHQKKNTGQEADENNGDPETIFSRQQNLFEDQDYVNVLFFIDENAEVQVVHTQKKFKSMKEQQDNLGEMNDYYREHIKSKIGHSNDKDKQQIKVTYVKNRLNYEDSRFLGQGLIEYFVKSDQTCGSKHQIQSNYLVAQTLQDQYLYVYKQNNFHLNTDNEVVQQEEIYNQDFTFDIVKIKHHNYVKSQSRQKEQILRFLENYSPCEVNQIPQIRINQCYKGLISCWWAINHQSINRAEDQTQIDLKHDCEKIDLNITTKYYKLEFQEADIQHMVFETINPPGRYFSIMISSKLLIYHLEETHKSMNKLAKIKFYMVPIAYFIKKNLYYVILELKVFYRGKSQYFFTAENMLVKFKMTKSYAAYNASNDHGDETILGLDTMVQFFKCPNETRTATEDSIKNEIDQFELSDLQKLADYNLFKSNMFDFDDQVMENFSKVRMKPRQKQTLFRFEKIVDSKIQNSFMPFVSYQKDILPLGVVPNSNVCIFNNFMMQALYYVGNSSELHDQNEKMSVTPSIITNPKKIDRMTILQDNQIQLWRCSDYFKSKNGSIVVHYKNSLVFDQMIDRVQVQEFKLTFTQKGKLSVFPVARTEKLISCINSQIYQENLQIIQNKVDHLSKSGNKDVFDIIQNKRSKYYRNHELSAALAVNFQDFNDDGYLDVQKKNNCSEQHTMDDLVPFNQAYRSPFLQFGYQKQEMKDARCYEFTFHARLNDECIVNKVLNKHEAYQLFEEIIITMLKMKPVLLQDFEFLLLHSQKTFEFKMQMQDSFFQPQELFIGQSMLDININDPSLISNEISRLIYNEQRKKDDNDEELEEEVQPLYIGSLFHNLTQNNPNTSLIKEEFQLEVGDYLMLSKDFHFKTQLIRCLDINADNSYKIIIESISKINCHRYVALLENDLLRIISKNENSEIFKFFEVTNIEELEEMKQGSRNMFCNFESSLIHEDLPTVWNNEGLRLAMYRFRDPQNQFEEIVQKLANMASNFDASENVIQVQHKYVDFQQITLGDKIRCLYEFIVENSENFEEMDSEQLTKFNLEKFQHSFDDLSLAQMMHQEEANPQFYNLETIQKIVDAQFDKAYKYFSNLFVLYMVTFILPIVIQGIIQNQWVTKTCYVISLSSLTIFFVIELCQMRQLGMAEYLYDFWNIIDSSQFLVFGYHTYFKIIEDQSVEDYHDQSATSTEVYLLIFGLGQAFLKGQSFVRIYDDYGFLVRMIGITIKELYPFIVFYSLYIMFFGTAFMILDLKMDVSEPMMDQTFQGQLEPEKLKPQSKRSASPTYPGIDKTYAYMLYSFRNSIGDLATPNYDSWILQRQSGQISQISSYLVISLAWGIWLFQAMFMVIILLNYLIAVISQAYERVVNQRKIYSYQHKAEINLNYFQIKNQLDRNLKKIKFMVFVEPCRMIIDGDQEHWLGFVHAIQKLMRQNDLLVRARFQRVRETIQEYSTKTNRIVRKQHAQLNESITSELKKIVNVETQIGQVKEDLKDFKSEVRGEMQDIKGMLGQIMQMQAKN